MRGLLRILLAIIGIAIALLVAMVIAVALFVEPEDYRATLSRAVEEQTGRTLTLDGELSLSLFPCCGLAIGGATLSNPPGFDDGHFAKIDSARLGLRIWPLLTRREVLLGDVRLEGLDLSLVRKADGTANWEFDTGAEAPAAEPADEAGAALGDFSVAGIEITGARVAYRDAVDKLDYAVENASLRTGAIEAGEPFDLDTAFRLRDGADGSTADVTLAARVSLDAPAARATLREIKAGLQVAGPVVSGADVELELAAAEADVDASEAVQAGATGLSLALSLAGGELGVTGGDADLRAEALRYDGAAARLSGTGLAGQVTAAGGELPAEGVSADLTARDFGYALDPGEASAGGLTARVEARGEPLPGGALQADLGADSLRYVLDSGAGALGGLAGTVKSAGAELTLSASGRFAASGAGLGGDFRLAEISPRELLKTLGEEVPATADPQVLTRLAANGRWKLGDDQVSVEGLDLRLDDSRVTGQASVAQFDSPRIRFDLAADAIDLDRYLAPESETAAGESAAAGEPTEIPTEALRTLWLDGSARIGRLRVSGLSLAELAATVSARDGLLRLDPLTARLYDGGYRGRIVLDARGDVPALETEQSLDGLQMAGLLTDFAEFDQLAGLLTATVAVQGRGRTDQAIIESLAGNLSMNLADGVYRGMDIWQEIRKARALIRRKPAPQATGPAETPIRALELSGRFDDGVLKSERLVAEIPFLRMTGQGSVNLPGQSLDYRFQAKVFETPTFPDGETLEDLTGLAIPVTITGPLASPKVGVDLAGLTTGIAIEKAREKLLERLGGDEPAEQPPADGEQPAEPKEEKPRDVLKRGLRDLLQR